VLKNMLQKIIFRYIIFTASLLFTLYFISDCASLKPRPMTPELWHNDLHYFSTELPKRHYNLFKQISREQFQQSVSALDDKIPTLSDTEIAVEFACIAAMIGGGHTEVSLTRRIPGYGRIPLKLYYFGDSLYVVAASQSYTKLLGARVLRIGNISVSDAFKTVVPLLSHDNEMEFIDSAPRYLVCPAILHSLKIIPQKERAVFLLQSLNGEKFTLDLRPVPYSQLQNLEWVNAWEYFAKSSPLYLQHPEKHYWYIYLKDSKTLYFKYDVCNNQNGQKSIKWFSDEMFSFVDTHPIERFVIDLRDNSGGNYHRSKPIIEGIVNRPSINKKGKLFVIIGRRTYSAALITAIELKRKTEALFVGERSRGKPNGQEDVKHFRLPNSLIEVDYAVKSHILIPKLGDNPYFPLNIIVKQSARDYFAGRDAVLEKILSIENN